VIGVDSYDHQMSIGVEWDVPYAGESVPFGDLASFVARAGALGAEPNTPVLAATALQDDSVIVAFRVELDEASPIDRQPVVCLDRSDVVEAVAVLEAIEDNEGDARTQLAAVRELRQRMTKLAIA
jgi:hypothetical protein